MRLGAVSAILHYQQWVDAHERGPAWVGGAEGAEAAGVGVSAAGAHQGGLQLGVLCLHLEQSLLHVALSFQHLQIVPEEGRGLRVTNGICKAHLGAQAARPPVPFDSVL